LISYYKTNGIIFLTKQMDACHSIIAQRFKEEAKNMLKGIKER
jgi:hypothetical protein